jgi:starch synthase
MTGPSTNPRVLIVTPEVTYLPDGMGQNSNGLNAKAGGLADVSAALINALYNQGADVHVALPDYRSIFNGHLRFQRRMISSPSGKTYFPLNPIWCS